MICALPRHVVYDLNFGFFFHDDGFGFQNQNHWFSLLLLQTQNNATAPTTIFTAMENINFVNVVKVYHLFYVFTTCKE